MDNNPTILVVGENHHRSKKELVSAIAKNEILLPLTVIAYTGHGGLGVLDVPMPHKIHTPHKKYDRGGGSKHPSICHGKEKQARSAAKKRQKKARKKNR